MLLCFRCEISNYENLIFNIKKAALINAALLFCLNLNYQISAR